MSTDMNECNLSIWDSKPHSMSWYDHLVGRDPPQAPFITPHMELYARVEDTETARLESARMTGYQDDWYGHLMSGDHKNSDLLAKQNLPLLPQAPYFEYLFADAEFEYEARLSDNSIGDLSVDKSTSNKSTSHDQAQEEGEHHNGGLTSEDFKFVTQDGRSSSTEPLPDFVDVDSPIYQHYDPTSPQYGLSSLRDEPTSGWCEPASPMYDPTSPRYGPTSSDYGVTASSDTPTPYLEREPLTPKDVLVAQPQYRVYQHVTPMASKTLTADHAAAIDGGPEASCCDADEKQSREDRSVSLGVLAATRSPVQPISFQCSSSITISTTRRRLQPKSQKAKLRRNFLGLTIDVPATYAPNCAYNTNNVEIVKATRKRIAEDAIGYESTNTDDGDVQYICTKKMRYTIDDDGTEVEFEKTPRCAIDLIGLPDTPDNRSSVSDLFNHHGLVVAPKGYAGQFDGMLVDSHGVANFKYNFTEEELGKLHGNNSVNFGDGLHPNGIFTHSAFTMDPWYYTSDLTREHLPSGHPLRTCMHYAHDMTIAAAHLNVVKLRNHDEEVLRREAHHECAGARLEGVSVGYYRYYQGHLSIEEYNGAEMCICWEPCACTKMCTRFGDLKCPCANNITVHGD